MPPYPLALVLRQSFQCLAAALLCPTPDLHHHKTPVRPSACSNGTAKGLLPTYLLTISSSSFTSPISIPVTPAAHFKPHVLPTRLLPAQHTSMLNA